MSIDSYDQRELVLMRDGIRLATYIYFPQTHYETYPVILIRSPYRRKATMKELGDSLVRFLAEGYIIIYQYERGRFSSEGTYSFLVSARSDGYETIDWVAKQVWSNGKVGTFGCSSSAENQLALAVAAHPAHGAAIAQSPGAGIGRIGPFCEQGNIYRGGALQLFYASWFNQYMASSDQPIDTVTLPADYQAYFRHLPSSEINCAITNKLTDWDRFSKQSPADSAWNSVDFINEGDPLAIPMLWVCSWYDIAVAPNLLMYQDACDHAVGRAKSHQQLIIGPSTHCQFGKESGQTLVGDRDIGNAQYDYAQHYIDWFDHWLKGVKGPQYAPVSFFQMGENNWQSAAQFPPRIDHHKTLYLHSEPSANSRLGGGLLSENAQTSVYRDSFYYDPTNPVPTLGGGVCCMGDMLAAGAYNQSEIELRDDILVYTSAPLEEALSATGFVNVVLFVASSAKDTDFTVKLVDVYPDGRAYNLDDTIFRARYREGYEQSLWLSNDQIYKLCFPPMATANTFKRGHRIRVEVSSSNFPRYERNLNTGGRNYDESQGIIAENSVIHGAEYSSYIRLDCNSLNRCNEEK